MNSSQERGISMLWYGLHDKLRALSEFGEEPVTRKHIQIIIDICVFQVLALTILPSTMTFNNRTHSELHPPLTGYENQLNTMPFNWVGQNPA